MKPISIVRAAVFTLLLLLTAPFARNQQATRRDGNWWVDEDRASKLNYVTGFFDGMDLGNRFSYWGLEDDPKSVTAAKVIGSYSSYSKKYLSEVTNGQLVDGLDKLYSDYRNRRIDVMGAVWLVVNGIAGKPEAEMQKLIENWRKNAIPPQ
jgi:hypothetical protein